jgi:hypothetical protein
MKHVKLITMNINNHGYYLQGLKLDKIILFVPSAGQSPYSLQLRSLNLIGFCTFKHFSLFKYAKLLWSYILTNKYPKNP